MDDHADQQAQRVDNDVAFATYDLLTCTEAPYSAASGGLDRPAPLAVSPFARSHDEVLLTARSNPSSRQRQKYFASSRRAEGPSAEANAAVSGNTIQNAYFGIALGTNDYTSDLNASGNVVRETTVAIAVSSTTPTEILVASNLLAGYSSGAIKAFAYTGSIPPYSIIGSELCPANRGSAASGKINMIGNVRRATL